MLHEDLYIFMEHYNHRLSFFPGQRLLPHTARMRGPAQLAVGRRCATSLLALCLLAVPVQAAPVLLLEAHRGLRTEEAARLLEALREPLERHGAVVLPERIAALDNEVLPLPARWDDTLTAAELTARLEAGVRSYLLGRFRLAAQQLEAALAAAHRNPLLLVADTSSRQWMTQALVSLALARSRLGDPPRAAEALAEQIRSYPELPVTHAAFGSRGDALYTQTRRALESEPRGGLMVDVSNADARIYINEVGRGRGGAFASDVLPGAYRVLIVLHGKARRYRISVHGNAQTRLLLDWDEESRFALGRDWAGLELVGLSAAEAEAALRSRARRLQFHDALYVGIAPGPRGGALWGAVYQRGTGRKLRQVQLPLAQLGPRQLEQFAAALLAGDLVETAPAEVAATVARATLSPHRAGAMPAPAAGNDRNDRNDRRVPRILGWAFVGLGMLAIGGGISTMVLQEPTCTPSGICQKDPAVAAWAAASIASGLVSCGVGALLVLDARRPPTARALLSLAPTSDGALAIAAWRF